MNKALAFPLAAALLAQAPVALAAPPTGDDVVISDAARTHFRNGVSALRLVTREGFEVAYREFRAAYDDSPTWRILGNLGVAAHRLHRNGEALRFLQAYLEQGGNRIPPEERPAVLKDIQELKAGLAAIQIQPPSGWSGYWIIDRPEAADGRDNRYGPFSGPATLDVGEGKRAVIVENAAGERSAEWQLDLSSGARAAYEFKSSGSKLLVETPPEAFQLTGQEGDERAPEVDVASPTGAYLAWGGAAIAAGAAVGFVLHANALQSTENRRHSRLCPDGAEPGNPACPATTEGDESVARWRTAALVSGVGAVAGAALGTWLYLRDDEGRTLSAWVGADQLGLQGTF